MSAVRESFTGLAVAVTEDSAGRFGMHDLLRLFARDTCQQTVKAMP